MKRKYIQMLRNQKFVLFILVFSIAILIMMGVVIDSGNEAKIPSNGTIVEIAESQVGNKGGKPYWSWYGFDEHVDWCACFVSWCADKAGCIKGEKFQKFSFCPDGVNWFVSNKDWYEQDISPKTGMVVFFDRNKNGEADHVGIVKQCEDGIVRTIEGNSNDRCREKVYPVGSDLILGYGVIR